MRSVQVLVPSDGFFRFFPLTPGMPSGVVTVKYGSPPINPLTGIGSAAPCWMAAATSSGSKPEIAFRSA